MTDNILYTIYKIYDINNEMTFYGTSKLDFNKILHKYRYFYKQYTLDNIKNKYQIIFKIFEKYDKNNIFIIEIDNDDSLINIKEKIHNLIINDKNCINFKNKMSKDESYLNTKNNKIKWRLEHKDYLKDYMNNYFEKNNDKKEIYYKKSLIKLNKIYICSCNSSIMYKSKLLHERTQKHINYIESL